MGLAEQFLQDGWLTFPPDPLAQSWLDHARGSALKAAQDVQHRKEWLRAGGTWFAGVDVLKNDGAGRLAGGPPLAGAAARFVAGQFGDQVEPLHPGQVSVTYPGYPCADQGESAASFGYRLRRDAAHLDGLLPVGPERRRKIREPHGYILGLALTRADPGAAPLVVWAGSHHIIRTRLSKALGGHAPDAWPEVDVTEAYQEARREIFDSCERVELPAAPGQAVLVHRLCLHGVAPWEDGASADPAGRAVIYFRPLLLGGAESWITLP